MAALEFAAAINCLTPGALGCGHCRECRAVFSGNHPDVRVWDVAEGEKTFKVEAVRELIQAVGFHPYQGRRKVHILAALDAVAPAGANALLKTLEEPPPDTTLILIARDLDAVLPTLVSRCQVVPFGLVPLEAIARHLEVRIGVPPEQARELAFRAEGRIGQAIALASEPEVAALPRPEFPNREGALAWADALAAKGEAEQRAALDGLLVWLRDIALVASGMGPEALRDPASYDALARASTEAPLSAWLERARQVEAARERLDRHANARLVFDDLAKSWLGGRRAGPR